MNNKKLQPIDLTDWVQKRIGSRPVYGKWVRLFYNNDEYLKEIIDMNSWYPMNNKENDKNE